MDEKRMGEIALILLKDRANQEGFRLAGLERDLGNVAKRTGVPYSELKELAKIILSELIEEYLE